MEKMVCAFCGIEIKPPKIGLISRDTDKYICDSCIKSCYNTLMPKSKAKTWKVKKKLTPIEIKKELDRSIIGQDEAKTTIAIAVYNHYKRMEIESDVNIEKSNILLIGPTGSGKTLIARTIAKMLDVPFAIADCTSLTEAGFVGDDVENVLFKLIQAANGDVRKAEHGIVFLDEIDKLASAQVGTNITKDPSGKGVQQALLKLIEGTISNVVMHPGRKNPSEATEQVNTENILFICSGAFQGLEQIVEKRISQKASIGFGAKVEKDEMPVSEALKKVDTEDLVQYGLIPELIGRMPVVVSLDELTEDMMVDILTRPKDSIINQYKEMFVYDGVDLEFTDEALREIAQETIRKKTGARGLRSIIENILKEPMFIIPSDPDVEKCIVQKGKKIVLVRKKSKMAC